MIGSSSEFHYHADVWGRRFKLTRGKGSLRRGSGIRFALKKDRMRMEYCFALSGPGFRYNRLSQLAMSGSTIDELRQWKGAGSISSITPYLLMSPIVLDRVKKRIK